MQEQTHWLLVHEQHPLSAKSYFSHTSCPRQQIRYQEPGAGVNSISIQGQNAIQIHRQTSRIDLEVTQTLLENTQAMSHLKPEKSQPNIT